MAEMKYQWSKMSPDRSEQVVVRSDNYDEWLEAIELARTSLPNVPFPNDIGSPTATPPERAQNEVGICPVHKKAWRQGKYGMFCASKLPDGTWCKEKP